MPIKVIIITTISSINVYISSANQLIYYADRRSYSLAARQKDEMRLSITKIAGIHYYVQNACRSRTLGTTHKHTHTRGRTHSAQRRR